MNKLVLFCSFLITSFCFGQTIVGEWETYDDKTNELKSIVEIYQKGEFYYDKINQVLAKKRQKICTVYERVKKNTPIIDLVIIEKMVLNGDGTILNPESGTTYKCLL